VFDFSLGFDFGLGFNFGELVLYGLVEY